MTTPKGILLIGVGNTIKSDDGIGAYICSCIHSMQLPGVRVLTVHQLDSTLMEDLVASGIIIIADACVEDTNVSFLKLNAGGPAGVTSPHYMSAALLMQMTKLIHNIELPLYVCSVAGYDFSTGEQLSDRAKKNADKAVSIISTWIKDNS
ncbi:MAG: hydrogenase maturation protease [Ferruginibacter sp.]